MWLKDIVFHEEEVFDSVSNDPMDYKMRDLTDPDSYSIQHQVMYELSKKLELATNLNVTDRFATSAYQVHNCSQFYSTTDPLENPGHIFLCFFVRLPIMDWEGSVKSIWTPSDILKDVTLRQSARTPWLLETTLPHSWPGLK